ncbi:amidase [Aridibaculum aurantiacum]|uniref:amidase n=1 Tax=Aridibaculum aurantiacum TaxID=2810307 RepID=UPI001A95B130|nr:amidase [Aridibaculum aurantiacum]
MNKKILQLIICCSFILSSFAQDTISRADINAATRLIGLELTPAEIDSLYPSVKGHRADMENMRKQSLPNHVSPAFAHSAILPEMNLNKKQLPVKWNIPANVSLPKNRNELAFYNILQLASLVKNKKISSVELTRFYIDRLKKYSDTLECVISFTEDLAMQQARQADKEIAAGKYRGPLHGIPYGLKDLFAVKGTKTTWGAEPYKEQVIEEDAYAYTQLKEAGAVLVAKFTLGALAMGDYWYGGRTRNPWNLERGSSGSSAGSASATAAGLVPFAIGTETWGSIITPSTLCGATGFRPTFGSISRSGAMALSWSLDKIGPICRSAEDAAIVFYYMKGTDGLDASAVDMPFNYAGKADVKKLRIGYAANYFRRVDTAANEWKVVQAFRKMGANVQPVNFPDSGVYHFNMMSLIISAESAAAFDEFTRSALDDMMTRQTRNDWPNFFRGSRFVPAVEYINANRHRTLLMQTMHKFFSNYDVIITPGFGSGNQSAITNLTGHPAICLPTGFNRQNMPTSITLLAGTHQDATLLAVAKALQDATEWEETHPPMFR